MSRPRLTVWLAVAMTAALVTPVSAQPAKPGPPIGIPIAQGVPGDGNPPDWVTVPAPGAPAYGQLINDPRWQGAVSLAHGATGANPLIADFRAVYKGGFAYLSWAMRVDPQVTLGFDQLYVGFGVPGGNATIPATLVVFTLQRSTGTFGPGAAPGLPGQLMPAPATGAASPVTIDVYSATLAQLQAANGVWPKVATLPAWTTTTTAAWISNDAVSGTWAINMKVPLVTGNLVATDFPAKGIPVDQNNNFRMWYEFSNIVDATVSPPLVEGLSFPFGSTIQPDPNKATDQNTLLIPSIGDQNLTEWYDYHLRQGGADPVVCRDDGISLASNTIGVLKGGVLGNQVNVSNTVNVDNVFAASPKNGGKDPVPASGIKARFRIANWGSTLGTALPGDELWKTLVDGVTNTTDIAAGATQQLSGTWTAMPGDPFVAKFYTNPPQRTTHQCVLVELSGNGPNLFFVNSSVFQNMQVVPASLFERSAQINIAGLPPIKPGAATRDVYLYVHTVGMPPVVGLPPPPPESWPPSVLPKPGPRPVPVSRIPRRERPDNGGPRIELTALRTGAEATPVRIDGPRVPAATKPELPSYTVYAWHDTGTIIQINGVDMKLVEPQTAFGYYVTHGGPLYGWRYALRGAKKLGPDFYVVSPPNGGSVDVVTEIEALESPPAGGGNGPCICPPLYGPYIYPPVYSPRYQRQPLFRRWR